MRDLIGNSISDGSLVLWKSQGVIYRVTGFSNGGVSVVGAGKPGYTAPYITLTLTIPVSTKEPRKEPQLADFLCVLEPQSGKISTGMLKE